MDPPLREQSHCLAYSAYHIQKIACLRKTPVELLVHVYTIHPMPYQRELNIFEAMPVLCVHMMMFGASQDEVIW